MTSVPPDSIMFPFLSLRGWVLVDSLIISLDVVYKIFFPRSQCSFPHISVIVSSSLIFSFYNLFSEQAFFVSVGTVLFSPNIVISDGLLWTGYWNMAVSDGLLWTEYWNMAVSDGLLWTGYWNMAARVVLLWTGYRNMALSDGLLWTGYWNMAARDVMLWTGYCIISMP